MDLLRQETEVKNDTRQKKTRIYLLKFHFGIHKRTAAPPEKFFYCFAFNATANNILWGHWPGLHFVLH